MVAAGDVMIFLQPGTEAVTVDRLAEHLRPGGMLVTGFQLTAGRYGVDRLGPRLRCGGARTHRAVGVVVAR
ncbi:MAG: hypothetical protein V9G12_18155 [Microthrixaceae bacterium]